MTILARSHLLLRGLAAGPRLSLVPGTSHLQTAGISRMVLGHLPAPSSPPRAYRIRRLLGHPAGHFVHSHEPAA